MCRNCEDKLAVLYKYTHYKYVFVSLFYGALWIGIWIVFLYLQNVISGFNISIYMYTFLSMYTQRRNIYTVVCLKHFEYHTKRFNRLKYIHNEISILFY